MSNPKTAIQEIKKLMVQFGFLNEEPVNSFKLKDNTIVQADKLEVGQKITKINDEFKTVSLENGSYRINNFEVSVKGGVIDAVKEMFLEAKLVDGTVVKVEGEQLVEGAKVVVVTEQGEIPAPDGVHELEGGIKVQTIGGVIAEVEEPEAPEVEVEMQEEVVKEEIKDKIEDKIEEVKEEDKDKEMVELIKKLMEKMSEKMKSMEDKMSSLESSFNAFKKEPAGKPVPNGKTEFNNETISENPKLDAILALRNKKK